MPPSSYNTFFKHPLLYSIFWALLYCASMNIPYYSMLFPENNVILAKASLISFIYILTLFYSFTLIKRISSILIPAIFITSSLVFYFSMTYGYAQNKEMFFLLLGTNIHEAVGVLSPTILLYLLASVAASCFAIKTLPTHGRLWHKLVILCILCVSCAFAKPLLPVEIKGKHPMPFGYLSHFGHAIKQQWRMNDMIERKIPLQGPVVYEKRSEHPLYIVLALGESLRADHLGIYGYKRETTPFARELPLLKFQTCYSAGTGTTEAVTRMLTRATVNNTTPALTENSVISLFREAGFRTVWLTNQGAMAKGETPVSAIAKESEILETHPSVYTIGARIQDADIPPMLDKILALPPKDTLIILHSFGSHINPEDRYADEFRVWGPVCDHFSIADCSDEELVNSYDNSVLATDTYWNELLKRLEKLNCLLVITGDHGDRLHGKYRGHDPKLMNNPALRWIPFMMYASPLAQEQEYVATMMSNAAKLKDLPISHDMLFHSLLGFAGIKTPAYEPTLDLFSGQAVPHRDPFTKILGIEQTNPM